MSGGQAFADRKRTNLWDLDPFEDLCIVGIDTEHKSRADHFYWDPRVLLPLDDLQVANVVEHGIIIPVLYKRVDVSKAPGFGKWQEKGKIAIVTEGRQRVRWARAASAIRLKMGHDVPTIMVQAREMTGTEDQNWIRSRAANAVRVQSDAIAIGREMVEMRGMGMSEEMIAIAYGTDVPNVVMHMRFAEELSPMTQSLVREGRLSPSGARLLLGATHAEADAQLEQLVADGAKLTVETVRAAQRSTKARASNKGKKEDEDLAGVALTLKQICKLGVVADKGEIECDPMVTKLLSAIRGKTAGKGIKGWTALLREIGVEV